MTSRKEDVAERLRQARKHLGLSQAEMAARMGVVVRPYQSYEAGKRLPLAEGLAALAEAGIDVTWLLIGDGQVCREAPPVPTPSLDVALLCEAVRLVEDWLTANGRTMAAERKAEVVSTIYDMTADDAAAGQPSQVARVLRLVVGGKDDG
ncbi:MAG: helix-turn-helix domain-containing protein [Alphaproteobacteria bacterium]|nr:helix-turn-helix domain-containing protein [Alphaproteobacteria bacterium]MBF0394391.1 helix-turn-helix domain-containing protein [Alphaproteobacteria bacterium]